MCVGNVDSVVLFKVESGCVLPKCRLKVLRRYFRVVVAFPLQRIPGPSPQLV